MTGMTPNLDELERLAQAATEGPWVLAGRCSIEQAHDCHAGHHCRGIADTSQMCHPSQNAQYREQERADAAFIAAADPTTILTLVAALRRVEALIDGPLTWRVIDDERNEQVIRASDLRAALNPTTQEDTRP